MGYDLSELSTAACELSDLAHLRFRRLDREILDAASCSPSNSTASTSACLVEQVCFPLVSVLVPKWLSLTKKGGMYCTCS